ncbi:ATP-binding protein [Dactylosporangium sp. McL0621]|uniref:ATP-binding protein n=1 Tax=Dactylosporangium sp. McL0621 TaxID=3415678 RepID=UPI003CEB3E82
MGDGSARQGGPPGRLGRCAGSSREHLFTIFTRPLDDSTILPAGTDLSPVPEPTAALWEARRSGEAAVSDTYVLLRDRGLPADRQQLSFVLAAPAYGDPTPDGRREFKGWVVLGLRGQDFIGGVLTRATQGQADAELWAQNGGGQESRVARLHQAGQHPDIHRDLHVQIANREWRLVVSADSARLGRSAPILPLVVGLGGALLTLLVCAMLWALAGARGRAEDRVVTATADLRAAQRTTDNRVALLNGVLERISDGVGVVDGNGRFIVHNPAAQAMLGRALDGDAPEEYRFFRPDGVTPFPAGELPLVRALAGESTDRVEMVLRSPDRPDGVFLSVSGRPLDADGQRGAIAVFHDITDAREREADLAAFAGIVAHDLKNPLTVIGAHAEMGPRRAAGAAGPGRGEPRAGRVGRGVHAAPDRRPARLRDRARRGPQAVRGRPGRARGRRRRGAGRASAGAAGCVRRDAPRVVADPAMLRRVLDNLVGNALKYVQPGRVAKIDISAQPAGRGWIRVEVADRGIGIPDADKPHVFESFHRAHAGQSYGGTGLGLAICRRIVDRHGGMITVTDNPGGGSRFAFTVPGALPVVAAAADVHEYV